MHRIASSQPNPIQLLYHQKRWYSRATQHSTFYGCCTMKPSVVCSLATKKEPLVVSCSGEEVGRAGWRKNQRGIGVMRLGKGRLQMAAALQISFPPSWPQSTGTCASKIAGAGPSRLTRAAEAFPRAYKCSLTWRSPPGLPHPRYSGQFYQSPRCLLNIFFKCKLTLSGFFFHVNPHPFWENNLSYSGWKV